MRAQTIAPIITLLLNPFAPLEAQAPHPFTAGARIRVTADKRHTGRFVAIDSATLRLQPQRRADTITVPLSHITKLELGMGTRSRTGRGALIGTAVGLGIALHYVATFEPEYDDSCKDGNLNLCFGATPWFGAGVLVASGALWGAVIGSGLRTDRWKPVPVQKPTRLGITLAPGGGLGLGWSIAF